MNADETLFLRVVELGSLKAAAAELHTNPSTVSRRLARLETRLGIKLLLRSTRRSSPTEAGARYADGLRSIHAQRAALEAEISGTTDVPRGRLRVTAPTDFGARFVVPVADALQRSAPDLRVELAMGSAFLDLTERAIDVAVRIGRLRDSALIARRLGAVPRILVGAPGYLEAKGVPEVPADLARLDYLFYRGGTFRGSVGLRGPGDATEREHTVEVRGALSLNSVAGLRALVEAGRGIHLGPLWAYEASLAAGRVVPVLPDYALEAYPLQLVYTPTPWVPARIRAFIDAFAAYARRQPALVADPGWIAPSALLEGLA